MVDGQEFLAGARAVVQSRTRAVIVHTDPIAGVNIMIKMSILVSLGIFFRTAEECARRERYRRRREIIRAGFVIERLTVNKLGGKRGATELFRQRQLTAKIAIQTVVLIIGKIRIKAFVRNECPIGLDTEGRRNGLIVIEVEIPTDVLLFLIIAVVFGVGGI